MLSRRQFNKLSLATAGATAVGTMGLRRASADTPLVFAGWGGDYQNIHQQQAFVDPFVEETGLEVLSVASPGNMLAIIKSQVDSGNPEWDVVELTEPEVHILAKEGYLVEIEYDADAKAQVPASLLNPYGATVSYAAFVLAWNASEQSQPLTGWADMWNVAEFPGPRTACSWFPYENVEIALLADGLSPSEINPLDDAKIERAFAKWRQLQDDLKVWWGSGGQSAQIFADGEVAVGAIYENRIREAKAVNPALAWTLNQAVVEKVHFVIPKSSQRIEEATLFINSTLRQENQAAFVRVNQYGASNPLAYDLLTADERAANIGAPENLAVELLYDGAFWAEAYPRYADAWEALKAGS